MRLKDKALVAHLFVASDAESQNADLRFVLRTWRACTENLGMTEEVPGAASDPPTDPEALLAASGLVAARARPGGGIVEVALRREHDVFCLSLVMEPDPAQGAGWTALDQRWTRLVQDPSPGVLGAARLFVARLGMAGMNPVRSTRLLGGIPTDPDAPSDWARNGTALSGGLAIWEASAPHDERLERRLVVLAAKSKHQALSEWTWAGPGRELPALARYLLHTAKLRYQLRVWDQGQGTRRLRHEADAAIGRLLALTADSRRRSPGQAVLVETSRDLVELQARELGLVDRATRLREMRRTVTIAADNLTALSGRERTGGLFADDLSLAKWFVHRLEDEAAYLEATLQRAAQVGSLTDQLVRREQQRRQEGVNLGLTGVVGSILMSLAAIQSLQYKVPLPPSVKPAVVTLLGTLALLASLLVLRVVLAGQGWPGHLVRAAVGGATAAVVWVVAAAAGGSDTGTVWTGSAAGLGFVLGMLGAYLWDRSRR